MMDRALLTDNASKSPAPTPSNGDITREIIEKANDIKKEYYRAVEQTDSPSASPSPSPEPPKSAPTSPPTEPPVEDSQT